MASARVSSIASVVSLQAKSVDGVWRDLTEGSAVGDREEILCEADGEQYNLAAYVLQRRAAASWAAAETVTLNVASGSSNYRQDVIAVNGDDTDSEVAIVLTVNKGQLMLAQLLGTLQRQERSRFRLSGAGNGGSEADATARYKGHSDDIGHGNKAELGGFEQDYKGTVLCDREQFEGGVAPARGMALVWLANRVTYRIENVKRDEISYALELTSVHH